MNIGALVPPPNITTSRPVRISPRGNVFKIPIVHTDTNGNPTNNYEVWTTKEAVQQHFQNTTETPREYQYRKFARQMYEKRLRSTNGAMMEKGMFVTTNETTHGNPQMWPHTISHPEVKV